MKNYIKPQVSIETIMSSDIVTASLFTVTDVSGGDKIPYGALLNNGNDLNLE